MAGLLVAAAALVPPLVANEYWLQAVLIPFLVYALAAIGLNLLTGYAGPAVARHRGLHGGGRLLGLQAHDGLPAGSASCSSSWRPA